MNDQRNNNNNYHLRSYDYELFANYNCSVFNFFRVPSTFIQKCFTSNRFLDPCICDTSQLDCTIYALQRLKYFGFSLYRVYESLGDRQEQLLSFSDKPT